MESYGKSRLRCRVCFRTQAMEFENAIGDKLNFCLRCWAFLSLSRKERDALRDKKKIEAKRGRARKKVAK